MVLSQNMINTLVAHFEKNGTCGAKMGKKCAFWVHILGPALGVNKGLIKVYKPSKFNFLTPLASIRPRTYHFATRIGTDVRISFHIYHMCNTWFPQNAYFCDKSNLDT